ncbi:MAG: toxin [Segetibacter sp.]|nr:toxin [Segetibacter sp.]
MSSTKKLQLRLRVFAGPNGSGKSTVIEYIRKYKVKRKTIDFGYYINADEIAAKLRNGSFTFDSFSITTGDGELQSIALASGLINNDFPETDFKKSYSFQANAIRLKDKNADERLAQILADFLRKKLLMEKKRFSFETVFSHQSKLEIMRDAKKRGYKVYLYFVSTESPEINSFRVQSRAAQGGHDVPSDKIESRYYRSLNLLYEACQIAYQAFFFDNSEDGKDSKMFAHFKLLKGKKKWDEIIEDNVPEWFRKYYSGKVTKQ